MGPSYIKTFRDISCTVLSVSSFHRININIVPNMKETEETDTIGQTHSLSLLLYKSYKEYTHIHHFFCV